MKENLKINIQTYIIGFYLMPLGLIGQNFGALISNAKGYNHDEEDIIALKKILKDHTVLYQDTSGLINYLISYRYRSLKKYDQSILHGHKAENHFLKVNERYPKLHTNYKLMALNYRDIGKIDSALIYFNKVDFTCPPSSESWSFNDAAIFHYKILHDYEQYEIGNYILKKVLTYNHYTNLENYEKLKYLGVLLNSYTFLDNDLHKEEIIEIIDMASELKPNSNNFEKQYIQFQIELASYYSISEQFEKSISIIKDLLKSHKSRKDKNLQEDITNTYINLAFNYERVQDYNKMLEVAEESIKKKVVGSAQNDYTRNLNYAVALMYNDQFDQAISRIDSAFNILGYERFVFDSEKLIKKELINVYSDLARLYFHFSKDSLALKSIEYLINISQKNIDELYFEQSKYLKKSNLKGFIDPILDSLYVKEKYFEFWRLSELLKATVAYDYLNIDKLYSEDIRKIILEYDKDNINHDILNTSESETIANRQILDELPNIYRNSKSRIKPRIDYKQIQSNVPIGTSILQYQFSKNRLYAITITADDIQVDLIGTRSEVDHLISKFNKNINAGEAIPNLDLFIPSGIDQYNSIIVIPDENLSTLPFDYLIHHLSTEINPRVYSSLSSVFWDDLNNRENEVTSLTFVDGLKERSNSSEHNFSQNTTLGIDVVKRVFSAYGPKVISPDRKLIQQELDSFSLFHFTGHAKATKESNNFSYLILDDEELDKITTAEISKMDLDNPLVVLSACETGLGNSLKGEGVRNFARAFIQAGASSVVQTLWEVNGLSTHQILAIFYSNLIDGQSKSEALWNAKQEFLRTCPDNQKHPYYWAGIIVVGNDDPLKFQKASHWWYWLLIPIFFGTAFYGYRKLAA